MMKKIIKNKKNCKSLINLISILLEKFLIVLTSTEQEKIKNLMK